MSIPQFYKYWVRAPWVTAAPRRCVCAGADGPVPGGLWANFPELDLSPLSKHAPKYPIRMRKAGYGFSGSPF